MNGKLIGALPKIGIRPCIDGRRLGVRESLEERTMGMARQTAELISSNLRYPSGEPVRCVIADTCIGGVAEAAMCEDKFSRENVTATLSVTPCWCYGTETMDQNPLTVKAVWGFNGTERPGAVYLAAVMAAHNQMGLPAFAIYGRDVQDMADTAIPDDVKEKILLFAKSATAVGLMRGKSYCNIGSACMGIAGSYVNASMIQKTFGMRTEWLDQVEIERRIARGIYDHDEFRKAMEWKNACCAEAPDRNRNPHSRAEKDAEWERTVKEAIILRDIMLGNPKLAEMGFVEESMGRNAIAAGVQGQRQWTDHFPNHDFPESILCSSFDWNGAREPLVLATENDTLNAMSMLMGHLLNDGAAVFADVRTYWSPDSIERVTGWKPDGAASGGLIHLINSGAASLDGAGAMKGADGTPAMKPFWEITDEDIDATMKATSWCPANVEYFRGGGFSSCFETKADMPVTMIRLNVVEGIGPVLQLAEGQTVSLPEKESRILQERTDPTWPTTWFAPKLTGKGAFTNVYSVMENWGANHGAFCYGHIGDRLITLASMLRIPVSMHNVRDHRIFRPHAWSAFGTVETEGADYRACMAYGGLY